MEQTAVVHFTVDRDNVVEIAEQAVNLLLRERFGVNQRLSKEILHHNQIAEVAVEGRFTRACSAVEMRYGWLGCPVAANTVREDLG
jgi:hypothetical protein